MAYQEHGLSHPHDYEYDLTIRSILAQSSSINMVKMENVINLNFYTDDFNTPSIHKEGLKIGSWCWQDYDKCLTSSSTSTCFGIAPTTWATIFPSRKNAVVGIDRMLYFSTASKCKSVSKVPNFVDWNEPIKCSRTAFWFLQGPHQSLVNRTTESSGELTWWWRESSVREGSPEGYTVIGLIEEGVLMGKPWNKDWTEDIKREQRM